MFGRPAKHIILIILMLVVAHNCVYAQATKVSGRVLDASTGSPLSYVTVLFKGTAAATKTEADGKYLLEINKPVGQIQFQFIGYKTAVRTIKPGTEQEINVTLQEDAEHLKEVNVSTAKHGKYRNKDNPAVELIRKVIENKSINKMEQYPELSFRQYDRLQISLSNLPDKFARKKLFRNYQYLFQRQDSGKTTSKLSMPLYLQEKLSQKYQRKNPDESKTVLLANKQVNFDSLIVDNKGLSAYLDRLYEDVNIYDNNVLIATTQFLSPIAGSAPTFYKYFITDTLRSSGSNIIELSFFPRNPSDLLLEGKLYIADNGRFPVTKAHLSMSNRANINFVRDARVTQDFQLMPDSRYYLHKTDLIVDFAISKDKGYGFTGQRNQVIEQVSTSIPQSEHVFAGKRQVIAPEAYNRSDAYWLENRLEKVSDTTLQIYANIDALGKSKPFKRAMTVAGIFLNGYYSTPYVEIGPTYTFYTFNSLEGLKLRMGGRTTTKFSSRYYLDGYLGYGFKDERWKGLASVAYALNNKSIYTYPQQFLRASIQRDTYAPGQELRGNTEDDFISSFRRGVNNRFLYNDFYKFEYVQEFENRFSFNLGLRRWTQRPAMSLQYFTLSGEDRIITDAITTSEINLSLRYAPQEKFYQGKRSRVAVNNKFPVFNLRYAAGIKGLAGGEYNYHNLYGSVNKRFYLSQLGITDVKVDGGYIFNKLPYPLLAIHKANQSYAYQISAYNMMNFLEFVSDHYASLNIDHGFGGFFLNKVPLLKRLKLREHASLKVLYGGLREENNPGLNPDLLQFQTNAQGRPTTYMLGNTPYVEGSLGLGNVLKFLRLDVVRRFNYLSHPDVPKWGLRAKFKVDL